MVCLRVDEFLAGQVAQRPKRDGPHIHGGTVGVFNKFVRSDRQPSMQQMELGDNFHGHTPRHVSSIFFSEFDRKEVVPGPDRLRDQAHEVEADGYAVHMILTSVHRLVHVFAERRNGRSRRLGC
jgi:hypothetical protein